LYELRISILKHNKGVNTDFGTHVIEADTLKEAEKKADRELKSMLLNAAQYE